MIPYYGKRELGGLTAAAPGDTIYFPFHTFNDSGDSEALAGLLASDIELFKNGNAVARATDSGYSLISDTGMMGDRAGLYRISIQVYNTTDDTGFFDAGSNYLAAIDAVTVDGKTVRFWLGSFDLGRQKVSVEELDGDTGAASRLMTFAGTKLSATGHLDTGSFAPGTVSDTGRISNAVWNSLRTAHGDTGTFGELLRDPATASVDTGLVNNAVWNGTLDAHVVAGTFGAQFPVTATVDTGPVNNSVWNGLRADHTNSSTFGGYVRSSLVRVTDDTGMANMFWRFLGKLNAGLVDTGATGQMDTGTGTLVASAIVDTGVMVNAVWNALKADHVAANSFGQAVPADVQYLDGDTGDATSLARFTTKIARAGLASDGQFDTGTGTLNIVATTDTGQVNNAVWNGLRADHTVAGTFGLAVPADVTRLAGDTGSAGHLRLFGDKVNALGELDTGSFAGGGIAVALAQSNYDAIAAAFLNADSGVETGVTPKQALRGMSAVLFGTDSGANTATNVFRDVGGGGVARITSTVDDYGNRSTVTKNL